MLLKKVFALLEDYRKLKTEVHGLGAVDLSVLNSAVADLQSRVAIQEAVTADFDQIIPFIDEALNA